MATHYAVRRSSVSGRPFPVKRPVCSFCHCAVNIGFGSVSVVLDIAMDLPRGSFVSPPRPRFAPGRDAPLDERVADQNASGHDRGERSDAVLTAGRRPRARYVDDFRQDAWRNTATCPNVALDLARREFGRTSTAERVARVRDLM